jgi:hypothetical protein
VALASDALIAAHQSQLAQVRERLTDYAATLWAGLGSWRDDDVDRFVALMVPRVLAGRAKVAGLTDAYLAQLAGTDAAGPIDTTTLRGVAVADLYRRPASTLYAGLAEGKPLDVAQAAASARLASLVVTDMQMAAVRQSQRTLGAAPRTTFYRRVLNGAGDCAMCIIASTQRYRKSKLLPIHPGCDCTTAPVDADQSLVLDSDALDRVHSQVEGLLGEQDRSGRKVDYRKFIVEREHGEIGPLLTWKHQQFTSAADIAA